MTMEFNRDIISQNDLNLAIRPNYFEMDPTSSHFTRRPL